MIFRRAVIGIALVTGLGCASAPVPVAKVAESKASIRAAQEAGASKTPQASLHLKMAQDQLARAQQLIEKDENEKAKLFLDQAHADAELALAIAHEERERNAMEAARARVEKLQSKNTQ